MLTSWPPVSDSQRQLSTSIRAYVWSAWLGSLPENSIRVHNKQATECNTSFFNKNSVVPGDCLVKVGDLRVLEAAQTSLLTRLLDPGLVGEVRVGGDSDHLAVDVFELLDPLGESDDFSGADEGEVQGIEIDDHIFALRYKVE